MQSLSDSRAGRVFILFSGFAGSLDSSAESPHRLQCLGPQARVSDPTGCGKMRSACLVPCHPFREEHFRSQAPNLEDFGRPPCPALDFRSGGRILCLAPAFSTTSRLAARQSVIMLATACCKTSLLGRVSHQLCSRKHRLP